MYFSYLHYSKYKKCPKQYKLSFVERPSVYIPINMKNAYIGLVLQKLVERFYLESWWKAKEGAVTRMRMALPQVSQFIIEANPITMRDDELAQWMVVANDTIPLIIASIRKERFLTEEVYVEREEEIIVDDDKFQMKPDLIIVDRNEVITLLDGKGGKTIGRYVDDDQLYFYALGVKKVWKRLPHRIGFWWYRHSKVVWLPVSNDHVDQVVANAQSYIGGIKAGKFDATPGQHCRLCDFRLICPEGSRFISERHRSADVDIPDNAGFVDF